MPLSEKGAIVSGAAGHLGRAVVKTFTDAGASVTAVYRNSRQLDELLNTVGEHRDSFTTFEADLTVEDQVKAMVDHACDFMGGVDILVNVAGGYVGGKSVVQSSVHLFDEMININVKTAFLCSREVLPYMIKQKSGVIINLTSRISDIPLPLSVLSATSKGAIDTFTEMLADEVKDHHVRVNAVAPSVIDTPATRAAYPDEDFTKWVTPETVANAILALASDESIGISGAICPVYGKM